MIRLDLSERERQVLDGMARGLSMKQIAHELGLAHQTTCKFREAIRLKLRARTDIAIYLAAVENGIIEPAK